MIQMYLEALSRTLGQDPCPIVWFPKMCWFVICKKWSGVKKNYDDDSDNIIISTTTIVAVAISKINPEIVLAMYQRVLVNEVVKEPN